MHASVCDYILDCLQNSIESGADLIDLEILENQDEFRCGIHDNGCGMEEHELKRAKDPFYTDGKKHVSRKVGLGLPFLIQAAELCGGDFSLESEKGKGTHLAFSFPKNSLDMPPLGDLAGTTSAAMCFPGNYNLRVNRSWKNGKGAEAAYTLSRTELLDILGEFESVSNISLLRQYICSQEEEISVQEQVLSAT